MTPIVESLNPRTIRNLRIAVRVPWAAPMSTIHWMGRIYPPKGRY
jgi:hypothetical protein